MKLPVYSRADLSRTVAVVVAPFLTAVSTTVEGWEFHADTQNEDYPSVLALHYMGRTSAERSGGRHQLRGLHSRQPGDDKKTVEQAGADDLNRTDVARSGGLVRAGARIVTDFDRKPFEAAMTGIYPRVQGDPVTAGPERIRKVE